MSPSVLLKLHYSRNSWFEVQLVQPVLWLVKLEVGSQASYS